MSLVFKPKIPDTFSVKPTMTQHSAFDQRQDYGRDPQKGTIFKEYEYRDLKKTTSRKWTEEEIEALCRFRAIGISYRDCSKLLKRSPASCVATLDNKDKHGLVKKLREAMVEKVIQETGIFVDG